MITETADSVPMTGEPIGLAPKGKPPETAAVLNVGGSAVTNCVTVLRREE